MPDLDDLMHEVALANRMLAEMGLADGPTIERGHVSLRIPGQPDRFIIKGLGPALSMTEADDMVVVNLDGFRLEGPASSTCPTRSRCTRASCASAPT